MKLSELARIVGGDFVGTDVEITGAPQFDSRKVASGDLFLALVGDHMDGHAFVGDALARGAVGSMVTQNVEGPHVLVDDVLVALQRWAEHHRLSLPKLFTIGITGSQGKTTAKDFTAQILERVAPTVSPEGSYNNDLGAPLTLLRCTEETRFCVLEMGARHQGDIGRLARMAHLNLGSVLLVGTAHLGEFGSRQGIADTKAEILEDLSESGIAVLGTYDEFTPLMVTKTRAKVVKFGPDGDVTARNIKTQNGRSAFTLMVDGEAAEVTLQMLGEHHVANALAAAAIAHACGVRTPLIAEALSSAEPRSKWRMELVERSDGALVINDAYNASPESVRAALRTLVELARERGGRSWAVLGEMRELGESAIEEHDAIGRLAVRLDVSRLIAVGEGARAIHLGAAHEGSWGEESIFVNDVDDALTHLVLDPRDVLLVKASRAVGLERIVEEVLKA